MGAGAKCDHFKLEVRACDPKNGRNSYLATYLAKISKVLKCNHNYKCFMPCPFYGSKMILACPNYFGRIPIVLDMSNSFLLGPNHFGQFQIIKISPEKSNLYPTKMIWLDQSQIGLIEG